MFDLALNQTKHDKFISIKLIKLTYLSLPEGIYHICPPHAPTRRTHPYCGERGNSPTRRGKQCPFFHGLSVVGISPVLRVHALESELMCVSRYDTRTREPLLCPGSSIVSAFPLVTDHVCVCGETVCWPKPTGIAADGAAQLVVSGGDWATANGSSYPLLLGAGILIHPNRTGFCWRACDTIMIIIGTADV